MTAAIKIPLHSVSQEVIRDLQEKYPEAMLHVELRNQHLREGLSESRFWELIALLDWSEEDDDEAVVEPLVAALAKSPVRHIYEFEDLLSEKLYQLDGLAWASNTGESAYKSEDEFFSVDGFLYDRCAVVANGREFFYKVLKDPEKMPKEQSFEALLSIASDSYERKTGKSFDYVPTCSYETFSNKVGWKDVTGRFLPG